MITPIIIVGDYNNRIVCSSVNNSEQRLSGYNNIVSDSLMSLSPLGLGKPIIVCHALNQPAIARQLVAFNIEATIVVEPCHKGSCAAITVAAIVSLLQHPATTLMVITHNKYNSYPDSFEHSLMRCVQYANKGFLASIIDQVPANTPEHLDGKITNKIKCLPNDKDVNPGVNFGIFSYQAQQLLDVVKKINPQLLASCQQSISLKSIEENNAIISLEPRFYNTCTHQDMGNTILCHVTKKAHISFNPQWKFLSSSIWMPIEAKHKQLPITHLKPALQLTHRTLVSPNIAKFNNRPFNQEK